MGMVSDVESKTVTATGSMYANRTRVRGVVVTCSATKGSVLLKDGGGSGTQVLRVITPAGGGICSFDIPSGGLLFAHSVHATLTDVDGLTIFYA